MPCNLNQLYQTVSAKASVYGKDFWNYHDAKEWYFMECSYNDGNLSFKLSEPVTVVYKDEDLQAKVEKVLGHIAWLLEEAQKPDSADSHRETREIKRVGKVDRQSCGKGYPGKLGS